MSEALSVPPEELVGEESPVPTRRLLAFEVGGGIFACDMDSFREIVPSQQTTRLPGAPATVRGLINLRGTIVTVIDGGVALARPGCARTGGLVLLVDYLERVAGIGVDDVRDIQDVPVDRIVDAAGPESIAAGIVTGMTEIEGGRVIVLDIKALVQEVIGHGR